jgi:hypothetical protein
MEATVRVRTAYPFHRANPAETTRWACLLECGHTIELELVAGERPRRLSCPRCSVAPSSEPQEFCIDFGD